ncbi:hypothetical protein MLDJOKPK_00255 [Salmonella phage SPAsTU]|nr:hypothetical protein STsAS_158 [Salmonella phage STsAS]AWN09153.1 hypothetical protein MLDJOKPK_00255 [Salmonella phage SPAsTU]
MNEITLMRFISDMANCQAANRNDAKLRINLMEEEVEGFLEYPRLRDFFARVMPRAWEQLEDWFATPYAERNLNNTVFTGTAALDLAGTVEQPKRLVFFFDNNGEMMAEVVNWIGEELTVETLAVGKTADGWVVATHQSQPYEEIKTNYLVPIYLDNVAPARSPELTIFLLEQTAKVIDSPAGRAWIEKTREKNDAFWKSIGHQKYTPR